MWEYQQMGNCYIDSLPCFFPKRETLKGNHGYLGLLSFLVHMVPKKVDITFPKRRKREHSSSLQGNTTKALVRIPKWFYMQIFLRFQTCFFVERPCPDCRMAKKQIDMSPLMLSTGRISSRDNIFL